MTKEREVTILNINENDFIKRLLNAGAEKKDEFLQRRYTYDFNPVIPHKWIRLRTNGNTSTLTIKEIKDKQAIDGTLELETIVGDFDITNEILNTLGYIPKNYQENYRKIKRVKNFTNLSLTFRKSSALWLRKWGKESMKELVDFIVGIATCNDCKNLFELKLDIIKARKVYLDKISNYDEDTKDRLKVISRDLVKIYFRILLHLNEYNNKGERIE